MMLSRRRFLTISASAAATAGVPAAAATAPFAQWQGRALGADVRLRIVGATDPAGRVWRRVDRILRHAELQFSLFGDSALVRLNSHGRLAWPGQDMQALVGLADRVHAATGGAFDPTVQPLWLAVAQGRGQQAARALTGWRKVRFSDREIALEPGMALTFNGIAQGLAADLLAEMLHTQGFDDVLIDAGEIQALGRPGPRRWQAGIAGPDGHILHRVALSDRALATSSPLGTRIGQGAAHILHPDGREPVWTTVSVSAVSAALADALSTAFCLLPRDEIDAAISRFPDARVEYLG